MENRRSRHLSGINNPDAVRVIEAMPRWTPGSQSGAVLNVKYNLAISFGVPYPKVKK